jgi:hypothetical protein
MAGIGNSCVALEESRKDTSEEVDKSRASSSMIKASSKAIAREGKGRKQGKMGDEESTWFLGRRCFQRILERRQSVSLYNGLTAY